MMILYNENDDTLGVPCTQTIPLITCHGLLPATKIKRCDHYCRLHHDLDRKKVNTKDIKDPQIEIFIEFFFFFCLIF